MRKVYEKHTKNNGVYSIWTRKGAGAFMLKKDDKWLEPDFTNREVFNPKNENLPSRGFSHFWMAINAIAVDLDFKDEELACAVVTDVLEMMTAGYYIPKKE